jgi:type I restriction enzyme R subunit
MANETFSVYAFNTETFGPLGTLGRASERDVVLARDRRAAIERLNPDPAIPEVARAKAGEKLTRRRRWSFTYG